jgi:endonuclease/exonuclease/phosphatase family metal-dependent hydrolase
VENEQPDIIALTEVYPKNFNLSSLSVSELDIDNYDLYIGDTSDNAKRGVVLYVKQVLNSQARDDLSTDEYRESVWCEISLRGGDKLVIGCVYRSPDRSSEENNRALLNLLSRANSNKPSHLIIVGDFNLRTIDWNLWTSVDKPETHISHTFLETLRDNYFSQHVDKPTRYRPDQVPSLLDLIIANDENFVSDVSYTPPLGKSDHIVLIFTIQCYLQFSRPNTPKRIYHKGDYDTMRLRLSDTNWDDHIDENIDVDNTWHSFAAVMEDVVKECIPCTKRSNKEQRYKPPWQNKESLRMVKRKRKAWHRYAHTRSTKDHLLYTKARNQATQICRSTKRNFEKKLASEAKENPKAFWRYVGSKTRVKTGISDLVMDADNNTMTSSDLDKAEVLNVFFSSVFTREDANNTPSLDNRPYNSELHDVEFNIKTVETKLAALNPSKSTGPDGLHPRVLKECSYYIASPLYNIMRRSLDDGCVPRIWKDAHVSAIFKKGKKCEAGNYRPISLTSIPCKVLESIVRSSIVSHMEENHLFSEHQHGFRSRRSTVTQLLEVLDDWTAALDSNTSIDVIYLDFAKAFDTVPHQRLLSKLTSYGIKGKVHNWIRDFLSHRRQRVCVNGTFSGWNDVTSGIPQGSVLGPILFVIFINDMPDTIRSICKLFADDTKVYRQLHTPEDCDILQDDIHKLDDWSNTWLLRFNVDKCKRMHMGSNNTKYPYQMSTHSQAPMEETLSEKDLGVTVDPDLKFRQHISNITSKANRTVGIIRRNFDFLDADTVIKLYSALVRPQLEYANSVWAPYLRKDIETLENVQRRATKLVPEIKHLSYTERLQHLNLFSLAHRRKRGDMVRVYKILNNLEEINNNIFKLSTSARTRGHNKKLQKQQCRKNVRLYSFANRVVTSWNSLPDRVVSAPSLNTFKARLDGHWEGQTHLF